MRKPQLFLLHFAGGNCHSFQFMHPFLKDFDVLTLELPGRGRRIKERLLTDFNLAARDVYEQLLGKLTAPNFLIYGHSMGAYLGLRVTNMLQKIGRSPAYLLVSGNAGPGGEKEKHTYLLEHNDFVEELKRLGGVPQGFLENKELLDLFEPILKADFEVAENNIMELEQPVNVPLFAMMGSQEETAGNIENWSRFTRQSFNYEILEGDHFFIYRHPQRIAEIIKDCSIAAKTLFV